MIVARETIPATVFVHGHGHHINWGDWGFLQLPAAGDIIHLKARGLIHFVRVRHTEHIAASPVEPNDGPSAIIHTDWSSSVEADD